MAVEVSEEGNGWLLVLSGVVAIDDARALHAAARATVDDDAAGDVTVLMDALQWLDTSAMQVLLALQQALTGRRRALRFEAASAAVADRWRRAGLGELGAEAPLAIDHRVAGEADPSPGTRGRRPRA